MYLTSSITWYNVFSMRYSRLHCSRYFLFKVLIKMLKDTFLLYFIRHQTWLLIWIVMWRTKPIIFLSTLIRQVNKYPVKSISTQWIPVPGAVLTSPGSAIQHTRRHRQCCQKMLLLTASLACHSKTWSYATKEHHLLSGDQRTRTAGWCRSQAMSV